jgi:26S proteasome regulatory subunit N11
MEVMGLMLGEFVDDYTITVKDVFAMPQSGTVRNPASPSDGSAWLLPLLLPSGLTFSCLTRIGWLPFGRLQGVSVEAVDPVFQTDMLEMLKQTGRPEMVVG